MGDIELKQRDVWWSLDFYKHTQSRYLDFRFLFLFESLVVWRCAVEVLMVFLRLTSSSNIAPLSPPYRVRCQAVAMWISPTIFFSFLFQLFLSSHFVFWLLNYCIWLHLWIKWGFLSSCNFPCRRCICNISCTNCSLHPKFERPGSLWPFGPLDSSGLQPLRSRDTLYTGL